MFNNLKLKGGYVTICAVTKLSVLFDFGFGNPEFKEKRGGRDIR